MSWSPTNSTTTAPGLGSRTFTSSNTGIAATPFRHQSVLTDNGPCARSPILFEPKPRGGPRGAQIPTKEDRALRIGSYPRGIAARAKQASGDFDGEPGRPVARSADVSR